MKFLVPNYSCLQNSWLGGYRPQIPVFSVLCPQLNLLTPPPSNKIPGYATVSQLSFPSLYFFTAFYCGILHRRMSCCTSSVSCFQEKCYFSDDFYETVKLNIQFLWDSTPCPLVNGTSHFTRACYLSLQGSRVIQYPLTALKMGVASFSQTLVRKYHQYGLLQRPMNHVLTEFDIQRGG